METYLIKKYQSDPRHHGKELEQLVDFCHPMIKARSYHYYCKFYAMRPNVSLRDYETVATTAVLYAALNYDCEEGADFKTLLWNYIKGECLNLVRETGNTLKMPRPKKKKEPDEGSLEECDKEEECEERKAISFDDVSVEDVASISKNYENDMYRHREDQRRVEQFEEFLNNMQKHPLAAQRKRAKRLQAFLNHIPMDDCIKKYCDAFGVSRTTLYTDLEAVRNFFQKNRTVPCIGIHNHYVTPSGVAATGLAETALYKNGA